MSKKTVNTTPQYWEERAKRRGKASIAHSGYDLGKMEKVTEQWWEKIKPFLLNSGNLLEIGCGWGRWVGRLSSVSQSYTGVDVSKKLVSMSDDSHDIRLCKPGRLSFDDDAFDTVLTITVLMHLTDKVAVQTISEIKRVLNTNGKVVLVEGIAPGYRTIQEYIKLFDPNINIDAVGIIEEKGDELAILRGYSNESH